MSIAVIADIVGSRVLADRAAAQAEIEAAVAVVEHDFPAAQTPLAPTVGDEFQGVYARLEDALCSLLLLQLALSDAVQLRFGIGVGDVRAVASSSVPVQDGPGWWAARAAIEHVHRAQRRAVTTTRTNVVGREEDGGTVTIPAANAYLLVRDQLVSTMSVRARRLTYGRCLGRTQARLARDEGITQSAVSQMLAAAGSAAIAEGFRALAGERA